MEILSALNAWLSPRVSSEFAAEITLRTPAGASSGDPSISSISIIHCDILLGLHSETSRWVYPGISPQINSLEIPWKFSLGGTLGLFFPGAPTDTLSILQIPIEIFPVVSSNVSLGGPAKQIGNCFRNLGIFRKLLEKFLWKILQDFLQGI